MMKIILKIGNWSTNLLIFWNKFTVTFGET